MTNAEALFVGLDVGTTGARASAIDLNGKVRCEARRAYPTSTPQPGWAEQDPRDWHDCALQALAGLATSADLPVANVRAIGLTGQCPTVAPMDSTRQPVGPGLLYRDNRATGQAAEMRQRIGDQAMHQRTGHLPSAFHVGPKVLWLREHQPAVFAAADCFMQPRDVVLHALTGVTRTDETHANSTLFFDLRARAWADDLLNAFSLSSQLFPAVVKPREQIGSITRGVAEDTGLPAHCPVIIGAADSQCAAYGSDVLVPGPISEMSGASSCLNSVVAEPSSDPRITHYSHVVPDCYCTELGLNVTGGALSWAIERFRMKGFDELEAAAARVLSRLAAGQISSPCGRAPLFLPYLGDGERDDPALRAAFIGLSDRHGNDELAYAVLEGLAFAVTESVSVLTDAGSPLDELRVGGGGARLPTLGQLKANALESPVRHLAHDSAPVGAALLAAGQAGYATEGRAALKANLQRAETFEPDPTSSEAIRERYRWFLEVRNTSAVRLQA